MFDIKELQSRLKEWGASFVGFSKVEGVLPERYASLKYAITIGIRLSDFIIDEIDDKPTYTYFHHYRAVNALIDQITLKGVLYIQELGYKALAVPASQTVNDQKDPYQGIFPHKTAAVLSGMGWIGRNGLFISKDYGPRVRLGTILTDLELPCENKRMENGCGNCMLCVKSCPAMALTGNLWEEGCDRSHILDRKSVV